MILGSTRNNINILSLFFSISSILGLAYFNFNLNNILITFCSFYILNILGNWMTLHRYYAHKSFEFKTVFLKTFFTLLALLSGRGSILGWTYIHRTHHAYSDTEKDPHSPNMLGFKLFGFDHYKKLEEDGFKIFLVKDLITKDQLFYHKYYLLIILLFITLLSYINIEVLYFAYIVPCFLVQLSQNTFNYFGHVVGYRNFDIKDNSRNNPYLFLLILGECWHNNHHASPKNYTTSGAKYEIDPLKNFIRLIGNVN